MGFYGQKTDPDFPNGRIRMIHLEWQPRHLPLEGGCELVENLRPVAQVLRYLEPSSIPEHCNHELLRGTSIQYENLAQYYRHPVISVSAPGQSWRPEADLIRINLRAENCTLYFTKSCRRKN